MNKQFIRRAVGLMPRSRILFRACELYCERVTGAALENNGDAHTNGEYRLLGEVAGEINVAFDVGANKGEWTAELLSLRKDVGQIHAFEPSKVTYEQFLSKSFPPQVHAHQMALSSKVGTSVLYVDGAGSGLNSMHQRQGLEEGWGISPAKATEEVRLDTFDEFTRRNGIEHVDFMKIDTEGHEVDVLTGASGALASGKIAMLQFEYGGTYIDSRRLLKDIFELLAGVNYTIFLIAPHSLIVCPRYDQRLENFQYKNFAVIRNDAVARCASAQKALELARNGRSRFGTP